MPDAIEQARHIYENRTIAELLNVQRHRETDHWWSHVDIEAASRDEVVLWTSVHIASVRFGGAPHLFDAWIEKLQGSGSHAASIGEELSAFLESDSIGSRDRPAPDKHINGFVAEHLWHAIASEATLPGGVPVRIEEPHFSVTDSGGDGLVVYQSDDASFAFRLWETKAHTSSKKVRKTVNGACRQIDRHAVRYLARFSKVGQDLNDTELAKFYGRMTEMWVAADPRAGAGVAVAAIGNSNITECFGRLPKYWTFSGTDQREGLLVVIDDFPGFARDVREHLWNGL